jgi:hypothetical protein
MLALIAGFTCMRPGSAGVPPAQEATETVALPGKGSHQSANRYKLILLQLAIQRMLGIKAI